MLLKLLGKLQILHRQNEGKWFFFCVLIYILHCLCICSQSPADTTLVKSFPFQCQQAIERAANTIGVPSALLLCIARVESGRSTPQGLQPWPWALNVEGTSKYFASKQEALAYVSKCQSQGITNIDVGILQLNFKWHGQGFTNLEAMLDPHLNALYAARFLKRLRLQHGSWAKAVAAYHSTQPYRGQAYITKVAAHLTFEASSEFNTSSIRTTSTLKDAAVKYAAARSLSSQQFKQRKPS
jgi:hypothetical protein